MAKEQPQAMTDFYPCADNTSDADPVECDNCDWEGTLEQLGIIKDAHERLDPGCPMPAGECPECGALAYLKKPPIWQPPILNTTAIRDYLAKLHLYFSHIPEPATQGGPGADMKEEARRSFQRGLAVGGIKVLELVLEDHEQEIPVSPAVDEAFQDLLAALRGSPQRPRKPSGKKKAKKGRRKP
jgi:hypothetical protein